MSRCPFHHQQAATASDEGAPETAPASNPLQSAAGSARPDGSGIIAAAGPSVSEDDLECPVCLRLLHLPSSLPCGHTFCGPCIGRTFERQRQQAQEDGVVVNNRRCPVCRSDTPGAITVAPNILLSALIEKFLPEAAARRRAEAVRDEAEERSRFAVRRRVTLKATMVSNQDLLISVRMDGASRCPMSRGSSIPISFYAARAEAHLPAPFFEPQFVTASGPAASWEIPCKVNWQRIDMAEANVPRHARVVLNFQPRFQVPPAVVDVPFLLVPPDGGVTFLDVEFDGRLVHN